MCAICNFKLEFGVSHPSALPVAVATRNAIEAGLIAPLEAGDGALAAARARLSAIDALNLLQARIEETHGDDTLLALPDFYVLLIENDTWGFFHATSAGFDPEIVPEIPDLTALDEAKRSRIVVTSEAALRGWLDADFTAAHALADALFMIDAPAADAACLAQMLARAEAVLALGA
ncbi:hypothetical protein BTH42_08265 [Burkholderia sp. SRS-W-2-2016]|uniref:hypothetical protein n=1 Tax=Burkholderia sp. SRS-W-2-2016 TaxID=1926878 RepID=UPI00094B457C|nr:hypothetical protein [Burkholderia sp. SRS-W-2-2016]OLL32420.1 hypothetical protein BTH42_08265 [Burkholderia sp. SRS-W-2-2016]